MRPMAWGTSVATVLVPLLLTACGGNSQGTGSQQGAVGGGGVATGGGHGGSGLGVGAGSGGTPAGGAPGTGGSGGTAGTIASGGSGAVGAGGAGGTGNGVVNGVGLDGSPVYTRLQRLTSMQWDRAVRDVLMLDASSTLYYGLPGPAGAGTTEFVNNEKLLFVDGLTEKCVEIGAETAAALVTGAAGGLARLYAGTDAAGFVRALGRRAFRRPLTADEETRYQAIFARGQEIYGATFANGASLVIRAMLQSPAFLYRSELGAAGAPLDGYEIASKLSFALLGTTPGDALLDAAGAGGLDAVGDIEKAAREMLDRPEAVAVMRDFHRQVYRLSHYDELARPDVSPALNPELAAVSARFFDEIFMAGEGLREILTSTRYFVGPGLAASYGVLPPPDIQAGDLDASRVGYFMQAPFLILNGVGDEPDTIGRGAAIDQQVLCVDLPGHPMPLALPTLAPGQTDRQRIEQATAGCAGCHTGSIDSLGFAFEGFDGLGRARTTDNGGVVDTSGTYVLDDGAHAFASAKELMTILADSTLAHTCYAKKLAGYALQRDIAESDRPLLDGLGAVSRGHSLKELVVALVRDPAFRSRPGSAP